MKLEKIVKTTGKILLFGIGAYLIYKFSGRKKESMYDYKDIYEGLPFYQIQRIKRDQEETPLFI